MKLVSAFAMALAIKAMLSIICQVEGRGSNWAKSYGDPEKPKCIKNHHPCILYEEPWCCDLGSSTEVGVAQDCKKDEHSLWYYCWGPKNDTMTGDNTSVNVHVNVGVKRDCDDLEEIHDCLPCIPNKSPFCCSGNMNCKVKGAGFKCANKDGKFDDCKKKRSFLYTGRK